MLRRHGLLAASLTTPYAAPLTRRPQRKDFRSALMYANQSMEIALARGQSAENTRAVAEIHLLLGELKSRTKECDEALTEYDHALELYRNLPEVTERLYEVHKGKLFCFRQLNRAR